MKRGLECQAGGCCDGDRAILNGGRSAIRRIHARATSVPTP